MRLPPRRGAERHTLARMAPRTTVTDAAAALPAPPLRPYVHRYLGYRYLGFSPGVHVGLPSGLLTVVVSLGEPTRVHTAGRPDTAHTSLAGGLHTRPFAIRHDGDQYGVHLGVSPLGCRALLGLPAGGLSGAVVDLGDVLGRSSARLLAERLAQAATWADRFAVLDGVLTDAVRRQAGAGAAPGPAPELAYAWRRVQRSGGALRVEALARETGWSRRHLAARFAGEFGLAPKDAARVARFERGKRMMCLPRRPSLAETAAACGYYDQSHLAREWRDLAGMPPSAWLTAGDLPPAEAAEEPV